MKNIKGCFACEILVLVQSVRSPARLIITERGENGGKKKELEQPGTEYKKTEGGNTNVF